ncbi:MAG: GHKL domain-containing protein [Pirellulales bacterium]|nr:GHKL domain-containing protein [Pirellulales bacterium]
MDDGSTRSDVPETYFAPAGRDTPDDIERKQKVVRANPLLTEALNAIPGMVMILNTHRQIVEANHAMMQVLQVTAEDLLAKRPGEVVGCVRVKEGPDGCGTSRHCVTCGAVNAILESQSQKAHVVRECRILTEGNSGPGAMDLRVAATAIDVDGEMFIVLAVEDISQAKRISVLQRTFFHDVLNTAGCISGYADFLAREHEAVEEISRLLVRLSDQLVEEINAQRDLVLAEAGDLQLQVDMLTTWDVLEALCAQYRKSPVAEQREIQLREVWNGVIWTDRRLLMRILGNMLKNGLEATTPGQTVAVECLNQGEDVVFAVHNPGVMPTEVQLQMFQRSFSTKGQPGRGIGTYSMRLLGEQYLGGKVDFVSREPDGTVFTLTIPKTAPFIRNSDHLHPS